MALPFNMSKRFENTIMGCIFVKYRPYSPGANFINKDRTIYLKLCVRSFLRSAYVSFSSKHLKLFVRTKICVSLKTSYF